MSDQTQVVPFTVAQKSLSDYETLKESPAEVKLLVEIYERRIAELNAVIEKLLETRNPYPTPHIPLGGVVPTSKNKITTTSQLVAAMERQVRIEGVKK